MRHNLIHATRTHTMDRTDIRTAAFWEHMICVHCNTIEEECGHEGECLTCGEGLVKAVDLDRFLERNLFDETDAF